MHVWVFFLILLYRVGTPDSGSARNLMQEVQRAVVRALPRQAFLCSVPVLFEVDVCMLRGERKSIPWPFQCELELPSFPQ